MEVYFFELSGDVCIFQAAALNNLQPGAKHTLPMLLDILSPLQGFKMHRVIKKVTENCKVMQDGE